MYQLKTEELCKIAINRTCHALQYVPNKLKTEELCKFAVNRDGYALRYQINLKQKNYVKLR